MKSKTEVEFDVIDYPVFSLQYMVPNDTPNCIVIMTILTYFDKSYEPGNVKSIDSCVTFEAYCSTRCIHYIFIDMVVNY